MVLFIILKAMSTKIVFGFFIILIVVQSTRELQHWRRDRRPKVMGDKIPLQALMPYHHFIQRKILNYHNYFRTKVIPRAANMLKLKWHKGVAKAAQKWAHQCMFLTHDNVTGRHIDNYGACGQNIFVASHKVPWLFAIKTWWLEKDNFTYGSKKNDLKIIGHYTQMVWASTHEVGCGLAKCYKNGNVTGPTYYNYVCNYCPIGNRHRQVGRPYRRGKPCSMCKSHCYAGKLCSNSCYGADLWANCREMYRTWPNWLCNSPSPKGRERFKNCRATCDCKYKIHD